MIFPVDLCCQFKLVAGLTHNSTDSIIPPHPPFPSSSSSGHCRFQVLFMPVEGDGRLCMTSWNSHPSSTLHTPTRQPTGPTTGGAVYTHAHKHTTCVSVTPPHRSDAAFDDRLCHSSAMSHSGSLYVAETDQTGKRWGRPVFHVRVRIN